MVVVADTDQLRTLVTEAVHAALAEAAKAPALLDRASLARALSCSPSTVDAMRKRGLPTVMIGDSPRFVLSEVVDWLRGNP